MAKLNVFSQEIISIPEILDYYTVDGIQVPDDRPYAWTMSVTTLDGYLSFKDPDSEGAKEIALAHLQNSGSGSDFRLLNAGWMYADAVLGSGAILRSEPDVLWKCCFDDLQEYRVNTLKKTKHPLNVVLSGSGDIDLSHKMFHQPDIHALLVTTLTGYQKIKSQLHKLPSSTLTKIEVIGDSTEKHNFDGEDFKTIMGLLRTKYDIKLLDVTAGGIVIGSMVWHKLVDEMRVTVAGQVCGPAALGAIPRPTLFIPPPGVIFNHNNNPLLKYTKIGIFGEHHIFIRATVQYRH